MVPRKGVKKEAVKAITLPDVARYSSYTFAWFIKVALHYCGALTLDELGERNVDEVVDIIKDCAMKRVEYYKKKGVEICSQVVLPATKNDPVNKLNVCYASKVVADMKMGVELETETLPPSLSIDFSEMTRAFMGPGRVKRDMFRVRDDVLALAVIGAGLALSYRTDEYGYTFLYAPHIRSVEIVQKMQERIKRVARATARGNGSFASQLIGFASSIATIERSFLVDMVKHPNVVEFLRLSRTGFKILVKGFDTFDVTGLAKFLRRSGIAFTSYTLLSRYPANGGLASLKRFIEVFSNSLVKYYSYRKPIYLYDILRTMQSDEINSEGVRYFGSQNWSRIAASISRLPNLLRWG